MLRMSSYNSSTATANSHGFQSLNESSTPPYEKPFVDEVIWISAVVILAFLLAGFCLNLVTVLVISKYKELRNAFVWLIFSLCVSDMISALISPLFWYRRTLGFDNWELPDLLCRFYWAFDITTSFSTAMHIVSFACLRLISIRWPFLFKKITLFMVLVTICTIWLISVCCGFVPFFLWFHSQVRDRHSDSQDARWPACTANMRWYGMYTTYQKIAYPIFLYMPLLLVVILAIWTSVLVYGMKQTGASTSQNDRRLPKQRQAVTQLILIVVSFLIGYIPFTAYEFWSTMSHTNTEYIRRVDYYFGLTEYFFIRLSECLNPVFYNLGSSRMRKYTKKYLRTCCKGNIERDLTINNNHISSDDEG